MPTANGNPGAGDPGAGVETPSGKDAAYENFPVGSWLLPSALRPHIARFYAFARAIDDIADSPDLAAVDKVRRLDGFERALLDGAGGGSKDQAYQTAYRMRDSLSETGIKSDHCIDLITAFKQDATKLRYRDWDDLMGYCLLSAAPVGRYLLDLHGGSKDGYGPSDALCMALQVINHLQDCQDDYLSLDRVYLPEDWMVEAGIDVKNLAQTLAKDRTSPGLRQVLDRCLGATGTLLADAKALPGGLKSWRLAMESAAILEIAFQLVRRLRDRDPLGPERVQLTKPEYIWCCAKGVLRVWI
jgi:squalene synthase HpnC